MFHRRWSVIFSCNNVFTVCLRHKFLLIPNPCESCRLDFKGLAFNNERDVSYRLIHLFGTLINLTVWRKLFLFEFPALLHILNCWSKMLKAFVFFFFFLWLILAHIYWLASFLNHFHIFSISILVLCRLLWLNFYWYCLRCNRLKWKWFLYFQKWFDPSAWEWAIHFRYFVLMITQQLI